MTDQQRQAVRQIAEAALACELATGCPAEISMSQCIFESGYLMKAPGNNCFGIKAHRSASGWQLIATREWFSAEEAARFLAGDPRRKATLVQPVQQKGGRKLHLVEDTFAAYESLAECFADHARIIQNGIYAAAWLAYQGTGDLDAYVAGIAAHYATDPGYRACITKEVHSDTVQSILRVLRTAPPSTTT